MYDVGWVRKVVGDTNVCSLLHCFIGRQRASGSHKYKLLPPTLGAYIPTSQIHQPIRTGTREVLTRTAVRRHGYEPEVAPGGDERKLFLWTNIYVPQCS